MPRLTDFTDIGLIVVRDCEFRSVGKLWSRSPGLIVPITKADYIADLATNPAICGVLCPPELAAEIPAAYGVATTSKPLAALFALLARLAEIPDYFGIDEPTRIDPTAEVHPTAFVADRRVTIGARTRIGPHACILPCTQIAEDVYIGPGTVIGSEGYQTVRSDGGDWEVPLQTGGVKIGKGVHIQANCTISRGLFGEDTVIGANASMDNQVHVAHDVVIGANTRIAATAMIAGRTDVGDDVWIGPAASLSNGLAVGSRAYVTLGSVVTKDVAEGARVSGNFAIDHARFIAFLKSIR